MTKWMFNILLIISLLASFLAGCNSTSSYDNRLIEADNLLHRGNSRPLALSHLDSISPEELSNDADRAYYSLLLTQARYLNYVPFTSEDEINTAISYYEQHVQELEKLTRSYLYKGAVLEDLGKPDTAMIYYKKAEVTAGEDDHFNRGYAQLRMGKLYTNHQAYDGRDIEKLEQAVASFRKANNDTYLIISLKELGAQYRYRKAEQAEETLNEAIALAEKANDTIELASCLNNLAYLYFMQGANDKSYNRKAYKQLQRIKSLQLYGLSDNIYTTFACVYANMGKPDSAAWFLDLAKQQHLNDSTYERSNNYLEPMSQIAKAKGNLLDYFKLSHESDSISFSSIRSSDIVNIMYAELSFEQQYMAQQDSARRTRNYILIGTAALIILSLMLWALWLYRRSHRYDRLILELKDQSQNQMHDLTGLQDNISEMKINDERLKDFISSHMGMMREMIEACYHEPNNRIAENMKRIVKFQDSNRDNWVKLYDYIDMEHNNIMTRTQENYPQLNDRDLLLLALTTMGYSYIQTAIIMGYSNATSVSVIKQRLAKKMGLECTLNEYIERNETDGKQ